MRYYFILAKALKDINFSITHPIILQCCFFSLTHFRVCPNFPLDFILEALFILTYAIQFSNVCVLSILFFSVTDL